MAMAQLPGWRSGSPSEVDHVSIELESAAPPATSPSEVNLDELCPEQYSTPLPCSPFVYSVVLGGSCDEIDTMADDESEPHHTRANRRCCCIYKRRMLRLTVTRIRTSDQKVCDRWELSPKRHRDLYKLHSRLVEWAGEDSRLNQLLEPVKEVMSNELLFHSFRHTEHAVVVVEYLNLVFGNSHLCLCDAALQFLSLGPSQVGPGCKPVHGDMLPGEEDCSKASASFACDGTRVTTREGYCYKLNTNTAQTITRRVFRVLICLALWIGVYSITYYVVSALTDQHPDSWDRWSHDNTASTAKFILLHVLPFLFALIAVLLWLAGPELCPKLFRTLPASKVYRVWLTLSDGDLSYYYKHAHRGDGHAPESAILLLLPGTRVVVDQGHKSHNCCTRWCLFGCHIGWCCFTSPTLAVITPNARFVFRFKSRVECLLWQRDIHQVISTRLRPELLFPTALGSSSSLVEPTSPQEPVYRFRFGSFAPERKAQRACWYVDGQDTFAAMRDAFAQAQHQVLIAGWMLSPEVLLGRSTEGGRDWMKCDDRGGFFEDENDSAQLSELLLEMAARGVQIRVMIYREFEMALPINSRHAAEVVKGLHPNIRMLRHPFGITLWSHHEKLVVVDQAVAFIGGIDLAFGRYDWPEHRIKDSGQEHFPGKDFYNPRLAAFGGLEHPYSDPAAIDRDWEPRMPWHDVHTCVIGQAAQDAALHFCQRWNNHAQEPFLSVETNENAEDEAMLVYLRAECVLLHSRGQVEKAMEREQELAELQENCPQRKDRDRDRGICCLNQGGCGADCVCMFRNNKTRCCGKQYNVQEEMLLLMPPSIQQACVRRFNFLDSLPGTAQGKAHPVNCQILRSGSNWSLGCKEKHKETSIHAAYIDAISNAKKFIYIENQFFISNTANEPRDHEQAQASLLSRAHSVRMGQQSMAQAVQDGEQFHTTTAGTGKVRNHIADALATRLEQAIEHHEAFKVIILLPNFPEGSISEAPVQSVLHFQLRTLSGCSVSLVSRVQKAARDAGVNWKDYLCVSCLRNHAMFRGAPVMNQIYVHSKLLIVDDRIVVCGSANINDRSMCGDRDSEVCVIVTPSETITTRMNGEPWQASSFAHSLRTSLWAEHMGFELGDAAVTEQLEDAVLRFSLWQDQSYRNTKDCMANFEEQPADTHTDLQSYQQCREFCDAMLTFAKSQDLPKRSLLDNHNFLKQSESSQPVLDVDRSQDPEKERLAAWKRQRAHALGQMFGHICDYPLQFLTKDLTAQKLLPNFGTGEAMVPLMTFT